jgi:glycosyltransferase involved in cell wall biosynthesis
MKILYIHQYFNTPETGGPIRSWHLSTALVRAGFEVELITSHNAKEYMIRNIDGVKVHYLPVVYDNSFGFRKRIFSFLLFTVKAITVSGKIKTDLCFATSTPLTVGIIALYLKWFRKIPYIFEVRDLWPEAPIQMGFIKSPVLKYLLRKFEKIIYRNSFSIIGLSDPMSDHIRKVTCNVVPVHTITNFSDYDLFTNTEKTSEEIRTQFNIPEKRIIITYFGAAGFANGLDKLLNDAEMIQNQSEKVLFVVAASGKQLSRIKSDASVRGLKNIIFLPYLNRKELKELLAVTDFSYLSYADFPVLGTGSPNKFFDSLAAGVPVISNIDGWWSKLLDENNCGCTRKNISDLLIFLQPFINDPTALSKAKNNARTLAIQKFERKDLEEKFIRIFKRRL